MANVLVFAEHQHGKFPKTTLVALSAGKEFAAKTGGKCAAVLLGSGVDGLAAELAGYGVQVYAADATAFDHYLADAYAIGVTEIAKAKGAKRAILLPVSAPFHCALMAPAARVMDAALGTVTLSRPVVPVVANVLAGPVSVPEEIHRRLVEQVTSMVRWRESIVWLSGAGVTLFVELGAGKVLSGLAKRIAEGAETLTVGAPDDIDAATARLA